MGRRELEFADFEQVLADLDLLASGWRRVGNWSLTQAAEHLALFFRGALEGFGRSLPWPLPLLLKRIFFGRILAERRMQTGIRVPAWLLPSAAAVDSTPDQDAAAVGELQMLIRRFAEHAGEYQPSPGFGRLSREEWRSLQLIHCAHHLSFLVPVSNEITAE